MAAANPVFNEILALIRSPCFGASGASFACDTDSVDIDTACVYRASNEEAPPG